MIYLLSYPLTESWYGRNSPRKMALYLCSLSGQSLRKSIAFSSDAFASFPFDVSQVQKLSVRRCAFLKVQKDGRRKRHGDRLMVRRCVGEEQKGERRTFLSLEEAGLVEMTGLSSHERFLCRLTISSLNLLRVISEQEGCPIEELNAGKVCDWFVKDRLKREQNIESAVLQWDESEFQL